MKIVIKVAGQQLKTVTNIKEKELVSGTQKFVQFQFILGEEWDG